MFKLEDDDQEKTGSDATEEVEETKDDEIEDGDPDEGAEGEDGDEGDGKPDWKARALKAEGILARKTKKTNKPAAKPAVVTEAPQNVDAAVQAALNARDLEDMDFPDEIKGEIKKIADVQGISYKKAAKDPYITYRLQQVSETAQEEEASISRTPQGKPAGGDSKGTPKFDMSTEEGRKAWDEHQKKNLK